MTLLLKGDAIEVLRILPDAAVNATVTSPPFWLRRDYGIAGQIGRERTIGQYLERLSHIFDEVWRVTTLDGTCWVNLGDKYHDKCAELIPERFAIGMVERGWIVRNHLVWHKLNPKPESIRSRFSNDWEAIFFFVKSEKHYFSLQYEDYAASTIASMQRVYEEQGTV